MDIPHVSHDEVERADGIAHRVRIEVGRDEDGKRQFESKCFDSYETARRYAVRRYHELYEEEAISAYERPEMTFRTHHEEYLDYRSDLARTTRDRYRRLSETHVYPEIGDKALRDLGTRHFDKMYREKLESGRLDGEEGGLSSNTVRQIHWIVKKSLDKALDWDRLDSNPAARADVPKQERYEGPTMTADEVTQLIETAYEVGRYPEVYITCAKTGARRGEVLGMTWDRVDLDDATMEITQALVKSSGDVFLTTPKSDYANRTVTLPEDVVELLRRLMKYQESVEYDVDPDEDFVFRAKNGNRIHPSNLTKDFNKILEETGLPEDLRIQDLRKSYAIIARRNDAQLIEISYQLGHGDPSTTARYYQDVSLDDKRNVSGAIEEAFDE